VLFTAEVGLSDEIYKIPINKKLSQVFKGKKEHNTP